VREAFMAHHADLLDAAFWQAHKESILAGHVHDVFPYETARRFGLRRAAAAMSADAAESAAAADVTPA
jgi:isocitrate dehydrogenase kinase/phosphatase